MAGGPFTSFGAKLDDLDVAWRDRLDDAERLLAAERYAAAIAAGLYALEITLKVRICKRLDLDRLPRPIEIHDLDGLLVLSGLYRRLHNKKARGSRLKHNWEEIREFSARLNDFRYLPHSNWNSTRADQFFDRLRNPRDGVLTWLLKQR